MNKQQRSEMIEQMYPDKVTAEDFIKIITDTNTNKAFIKNMKHLKLENKYPEDWAEIYCAWMELIKPRIQKKFTF